MRLDDFCKVVKGHDIVKIYIYTNKIAMKIFKSIKNDLPSYSIQVSPWLVFLQVLAQVICSLLVARLYRSFLSFVFFFFSHMIWFQSNENGVNEERRPMKNELHLCTHEWDLPQSLRNIFFFFFDFFFIYQYIITCFPPNCLHIPYIFHFYSCKWCCDYLYINLVSSYLCYT